MAVIGAGSKLQVSIVGVYTDIAEVMSIGGPDITVNDVEIHNLMSAGQWKTFLPGFKDGGTVPCEARFNAAQYVTLIGYIGAGAISGGVMAVWRILFSNGSKWDFSAYINGLKTDIPLEEDIQTPFALKISGQPIFTA